MLIGFAFLAIFVSPLSAGMRARMERSRWCSALLSFAATASRSRKGSRALPKGLQELSRMDHAPANIALWWRSNSASLAE